MSVLSDELENDPEDLGYAEAGSEAAIAELLNDKSYTTLPGSIPYSTMLKWLAGSGVYKKLQAATSSENATLASIASVALAMTQSPHTVPLDTADPAIVGMIEALEAGNVVSEGEATAFLALGETPASRYEELFGIGQVVTHGQVSAAKLEGNG